MPEAIEVKNTREMALAAGADTSEGAAMQSSASFGRILTICGAILAVVPQILDFINILPDSVKNSKVGLIGIAIIGGVVGIVGAIKETLVKISYVNGRSQIKAAAILSTQVMGASSSSSTSNTVTAEPAVIEVKAVK